MPSTRPSRRRTRIWLCLLALPPAIVLGAAAAASVWGRELYDSREVAEAQSAGRRNIIFGPAYSSPEVHYKQTRIELNPPDVLVLGSSRVLPFREEFFKPDLTFYNGGRIARDVWILRKSLERLPDKSLPDVLIVGLDQYNFNAAESDYTPAAITDAVAAAHFAPGEEGWERFDQIWPEVIGDLISGKIRPLQADHDFETIGMSARVNGSGFRNDGSYRYGEALSTPPDQRDHGGRIAPTLRRIARGGSRFRPGDAVNMAVVREVGLLAEHCAARGVPLVAFLPPYAPSAVAAMRAATPPHDYLWQLPGLLAPLFQHSGQAFFDFTSVPGSTDAEFTDGFHGGERLHARLLLEMSRSSSILEAFIDRPRLESIVASMNDPLDPIR